MSEMFEKGDRVQTHPATLAWMSGDRYGTVIRRGNRLHDSEHYAVHVRMDRSGKVRRFHPLNLIIVDTPNRERAS